PPVAASLASLRPQGLLGSPPSRGMTPVDCASPALSRAAREIGTTALPAFSPADSFARPGRVSGPERFPKVLIATLGEIAGRATRTARAMGSSTVADDSDAGRDALHVAMADAAVHIGPAAAAESSLVIDRIIEACKATGAEAVHPGYGFL